MRAASFRFVPLSSGVLGCGSPTLRGGHRDDAPAHADEGTSGSALM